MKPAKHRLLSQAEQDLTFIIDRWTVTLHRLEVEVTPGMPATTPGNGDPPSTSGGGHGESIVARLAGRHHRELDDLALLRRLPKRLIVAMFELLGEAGHLGAVLPPAHLLDGFSVARQLAWCRWALRQLLAGADLLDDLAGVRPVARLLGDARGAVARWGYTAAEPSVPPPPVDELAHDPTGEQCRSCLRVGRRERRYRDELCQWCYRFETVEGFTPPAEIVEARAAGERITDTMVAPHRKRHQAGTKRRR